MSVVKYGRKLQEHAFIHATANAQGEPSPVLKTEIKKQAKTIVPALKPWEEGDNQFSTARHNGRSICEVQH